MSVTLNPALLPPGAAGGNGGAGGVTGTPGATHPADRAGKTAPAAPSGPSFADVLDHANRAASNDQTTSNDRASNGPVAPNDTDASTGALHFSKHALQRVQRRGIDVSPATLGRIADGIGRAAGKGSRDSIVLVDGTAFVVSVPNRTVITAVGAEHMRDHVFTNIDSAVIA